MKKGMCGKKELELYVHIPFCVQKCKYCDFLSGPAEEEMIEAYTDALCMEISNRAADCTEHMVVSVFFGGGTPSLLTGKQMKRLLSCINQGYSLVGDCEITMEMNPGTVTKEKLAGCKEAGINRISIGCQSALESELKLLGRIHSFQDFEECYHWAREIGFGNVNVDLMSGLPGQTPEDWKETLESILRLSPQPEHISAYSLIIEPGTELERLISDGLLLEPEEETDRAIYEYTQNRLGSAGYIRYEVSNYCKPGFACRHNVGYWKRREYLGFGIGAASLFGGKRFRNASLIKEYVNNPLKQQTQEELLSMQDCFEEFLFLGLRMTEGISQNEMRSQFGMTFETAFGKVLTDLLRSGFVSMREAMDEDGNPDLRLYLTDEGFNVENYVEGKLIECVPVSFFL